MAIWPAPGPVAYNRCSGVRSHNSEVAAATFLLSTADKLRQPPSDSIDCECSQRPLDMSSARANTGQMKVKCNAPALGSNQSCQIVKSQNPLAI